MAYFLNREESVRSTGKQVAPISVGQSPYAHAAPEGPCSPLSQLVRDGYTPPDSAGGPAGRPPICPTKGGFDAGIAKQWSSNVQDSTAQQQQQHNPQLKPKTNGLRVSQAAGGQSSLSLGWDTPDDQPARRGGRVGSRGSHGVDASPGRRGRGTPDEQPLRQGGCGRHPSPGGGHGVGSGYGNAASRPPQAGPDANVGGGGANVAHRGLTQQEAYALEANKQRGSGDRGGAHGSVSYGGPAGNGGQNTGNKMGDRNSSRVLAPPGGFSNFSFG